MGALYIASEKWVCDINNYKKFLTREVFLLLVELGVATQCAFP